MSIVLDVHGLKKNYVIRKGFLWRTRQIIEAVRGVSFHVRKNEIFGLLGPNGAGKTTIVNILAGIVTKDDGKITVFGEPYSEQTRERMNVATAYSSLLEFLTVMQNLRVFARMYNVKNPEKRIEQLLHQFGMYKHRNTRYYLLSAGQRTRVNLCKGLINEPELLLLDEATVGLDPDIAQEVRDEISNMGTTIILTTHYMREIEQLCARAAFLHQGHIIRMGTPKQLVKLIKEQVVQISFEPNPLMDKIIASLPGTLEERRTSSITLRVPHTTGALHDVLHPLLTKGVYIRDLHITKPSLEDVFIKLTRK
ncbi:MAG TPA: ABC transporter ATP-binding protein [Candidatus Nanoarchaeia archaeon]|nr:ABC transporter ATP-binding protein [Candidatus Nanoarchaeia archaeon]